MTRLLVAISLLMVPKPWRDEVRIDLVEEATTRGGAFAVLWTCGQAIAIGARLRCKRGNAVPRQRPLLNAYAQDLTFAVRVMARQPGWTLMVILTLALGIGANTAVFSVVNATLLNPLPYPHAARVVIPSLLDVTAHMSLSAPDEMARAWKAQAHTLDAVETIFPHDVTWTGAGDPVLLRATDFSDTFPDFAGVRFVVGRGFSSAETAAGSPVAILSETLCRTHFGSNAAVLGRPIVIDGTPRTVIGVVSDDIRFPEQYRVQARREIFLPIRSERTTGRVIARLAQGASIDDAEKELDAIMAAAGLTGLIPGRTFKAALATPSDMTQSRDSLLMLSWAVSLVLLIACLNVAHLLLVRGMARQREFAIRSALGAGRWRMARQLVTESLLLTGAGGLSGVLVGGWLLEGLTALRPPGLDSLTVATMDRTVIGAAGVATLVTGIAFGLMSAWRTRDLRTAEALRSMSAAVTESRSKNTMRSLLVVVEIGVAAVLLVCSALLVRSVQNLQRIDVGFNVRNLYTVKVALPQERCGAHEAAASVEFCRSIAGAWLDRLRGMSGIESATLAGTAPPQSGFTLSPWERRDLGPAASRQSTLTATNAVRPEYFSVLGLALDGPGFDAGSAGRNEVVLNQALARQLWPGERAIGKQLRAMATPGPRGAAATPGEESPWLTVVGVTRNVGLQQLRHQPDDLAIYHASSFGGYSLILRAVSGFDPAPAIRAVALDINASLALPAVTSVSRAFDDASIADTRFTTMLLTIFAGVAVLLCAVGLYGVITYLVSQRTREIGIRLALGGTPTHIGRLVLGRAMGLSVVGIATGLVASRWAVSSMSSALYGVAAFDPIAYISCALLLLGVAAVACSVPMSRAMRLDPLTATRAD
jgi:predicted permease